MQCLISQPPCCFTMYLLSIYYESTIVLVTGQLKGIRWVFVLIKPQQRGKCKHSSLLTKVIYSKWQGRRRVRNVSKLLYPQQHTCSKYNSRREHTGGQGAQVSQSGQYISLILTIKSLQEETVSYLYLQGTEPGGPQMSVKWRGRVNCVPRQLLQNISTLNSFERFCTSKYKFDLNFPLVTKVKNEFHITLEILQNNQNVRQFCAIFQRSLCFTS